MRYAAVFAFMFMLGCGYQLDLTPNYITALPSEYTQGGEPLTWYPSNFPLPVVMDETLDEVERQAVRDAVTRWNQAVGGVVFLTPTVVDWTHPAVAGITPGYVGVTRRQIAQRNVLAQAHWTTYRYAPDRIEHVLVVLDEDTRDSVLVNVMVHELGHVLGLAHDEDTCSVMYRDSDERVRVITAEDLDYVRWQLP